MTFQTGYTFQLKESSNYQLSEGPIGLYKSAGRYYDFDNDSYRDLMLTLKNTSDGKRKAFFFKNIACTDSDLVTSVGSDCREFNSNPPSVPWKEYFTDVFKQESFIIAGFDFGDLGYLPSIYFTPTF